MCQWMSLRVGQQSTRSRRRFQLWKCDQTDTYHKLLFLLCLLKRYSQRIVCMLFYLLRSGTRKECKEDSLLHLLCLGIFLFRMECTESNHQSCCCFGIDHSHNFHTPHFHRFLIDQQHMAYIWCCPHRNYGQLYMRHNLTHPGSLI